MNFPDFESIKVTLTHYAEVLVLFDTEHEVADNTETMNEFLELFDIPEEDIILEDGTYVELKIDDRLYEVHASGNGDFRTLKIEIKLMEYETV